MKIGLPELAESPEAIQVIKRCVPVKVCFANEDGVCQTLEGPVRYRAGDALLEGGHNDQWPIQRTKFFDNYDPLPPTCKGKAGQYVKKAKRVWAKRLLEPIEVPVGWQDDTLKGMPGDWLLQYGPGDYGVVKPEIFDATYQRCECEGDA